MSSDAIAYALNHDNQQRFLHEQFAVYRIGNGCFYQFEVAFFR